jgi:hypothetical protein
MSSTLVNCPTPFGNRHSGRIAKLALWFCEFLPDTAASLNRVPGAVLVLVLALAIHCGFAGQAVGAESAGGPFSSDLERTLRSRGLCTRRFTLRDRRDEIWGQVLAADIANHVPGTMAMVATVPSNNRWRGP